VLRDITTLGDAGNVVNNLVALGAKISVASGITDEFNVVLLSDYGKGLLTQIPTMERERAAKTPPDTATTL